MDYSKAHSPDGYVANYSMSSHLCHQPDLQGLEGALIRPLSTSTTQTLTPMFAGSKLSVSNEIRLPAPMYWAGEERFTGGNNHGAAWHNKLDRVVWRGVATGGFNTEENWRGFQRHRFVAMNNGTKVSEAESGFMHPENFALPEKQYNVLAQQQGQLGEWIESFSDASFIELDCHSDDPNVTDEDRCGYVDSFYETTEGLPMAKQFDNKYVPDIDGNSFSGRYLGFLRSTSLPIKATIFREWHDSRIVPWKHFVPMDNRFGDYFGIMEYFLGFGSKPGHDAVAEKIAMEGKEWAEKVLRKEDMQVYFVRLMMEYARICDERRETMGWVADVTADPTLKSARRWW